MIPYGRQSITGDDVEAVIAVLQSDFLTQGPAIDRFEKSVADYTGAKYAIAVSNATAALHISCLSLGIGPGDVVWTSPNTFVASANCALYCGARVDFVDIDPADYNMDANLLEQRLSVAAKEGRLPKAVIPVHFAGQSCDMRRIGELSRQYGFKIIEDASHAIGGRYLGKPVGSCDHSDITVFSFHPVKIITTGEGGMIVTNNEELYQRLIRLRSHGITRDPRLMMGEPHGGWYYQQIDLGFNYRMTDIQAALGESQMRRLDEFVRRRNDIASRYYDLLKDLPLMLPTVGKESLSAFHLFPVQVKESSGKTRLAVYDALRSEGVGVQIHYIPVHTQPYYRGLGFRPGDFPVAEDYYSRTISLPMYYDLKNEDQDYVVDVLKRVFQ